MSGLPRSGTSMMMQMLQAGGMEILTDGLRQADPDNPRGYWEFEPVKRLATAADWMPLAVGKVVKVVHALVPFLPAGFNYRVILMHRDVLEVLASQRAMLERAGKQGADLSHERLAQIFSAQMEQTEAWLEANPDCRVLRVEHRDCLLKPAAVAVAVNRFLGSHLDEARMAEVVDARLHRQQLRSGKYP